jgi:hypothetical protein
VFLECGSSYGSTANALKLHRNTVQYRLGRVKEPLPASMVDHRSDIQLALRFDRARELALVLAGIRFPAQHWQLIAEAHSYGAGGPCQARLLALPARHYATLAEVVAASRVSPRLLRTRTNPYGS